jgi:hypothetical protein
MGGRIPTDSQDHMLSEWLKFKEIPHEEV